MRRLAKRLASLVLIPLTQWYLQKERTYRYKEIFLKVFPGVFHPGFFYSTKFLLRYLSELSLNGKSVLELGSGTGLISITAAKAGALVTASDLSSLAIENTIENAKLNHAVIQTIHSDLFDRVVGKFDYIIINPPYYAKEVTNEAELAWNCGKDFEYFKKIFGQLAKHIHSHSAILMVLTKGCDLSAIFSLATSAGFSFELLREKKVFFDGKDYIYSIKSNSSV
jgi:release factor glutamine methyltransferase